MSNSRAMLRDQAITAVCRALRWGWDRLPARRRALPAVPRLLILKPCCLGDVLMATPVVAALRARWPTAIIDFAVGPWSRPMVAGNPHIDQLLDCGRVGAGRYGVADWLSLARQVRRGGYDVCLVLDRSPALALIPALAGAPHRVGLDSDGRGFSLTQRVSVQEGQHEVDLYLACAEALGVSTDDARLQFFPTPEATESVRDLLSNPWSAGSRTAQEMRQPPVTLNGAKQSEKSAPLEALHSVQSDISDVAVVHPAGGQNPGMRLSAKRWPAERFVTLIRRILDETALRVILVGGAEDQPLAESIREGVSGGSRVISLAGALSFDQLGALLQRASLFVGNDTGAMHLAVAVGTPTVGIFGPSDPRQYGPYGSPHRAVWNPPACAPCLARGRWNAACRDFRCIEGVSVDEVWREISSILP
jgi:lipopolysaccharide heptosyltransferase II